MTTRRSLFGKDGEWILEIFVAGSPFRFGTVPVIVESAAGDVKFFEGLNEIEQSVSSEGSADFTIPVTIDAGDNWAKVIARHAVIERAPAILRRLFDGQTLEQARTVIEGAVEGFGYGEPNERIKFSIVRRARTQSRMLPTPAMVVDGTTWPVTGGHTVDENIVGAFYPIIIGAPGTRPGGSPLAATEGLLVEIGAVPKILIAGHRVVASSVTIFDYTDDGVTPSAVVAVSTMVDGVGRLISYCDMTAAGLTIAAGRIYYVGWDAAGGGLPNPVGAGALRGAGDVIAWMIRTWTDIRIDAARFAPIRERLSAGYKIDSYLNEPVDPVAWLNAEVFPILPIEPRQGEDGIYWYMRRWDATSVDAVARLDADRGEIQRESLVQTESAQVANEITVQYGPIRGTGRSGFRRIVGAVDQTRPNDEIQSGLVTTDDRMIGGYRAALSQSIFKRQPAGITASSVWDDPTATRIGQDVLSEQGLPRRFVTYSGGTDLEAFGIGAVIVLNDSLVQIFDEIAQILDLTVGGPDVILSLELFDDPVISDRLVS